MPELDEPLERRRSGRTPCGAGAPAVCLFVRSRCGVFPGAGATLRPTRLESRGRRSPHSVYLEDPAGVRRRAGDEWRVPAHGRVPRVADFDCHRSRATGGAGSVPRSHASGCPGTSPCGATRRKVADRGPRGRSRNHCRGMHSARRFQLGPGYSGAGDVPSGGQPGTGALNRWSWLRRPGLRRQRRG